VESCTDVAIVTSYKNITSLLLVEPLEKRHGGVFFDNGSMEVWMDGWMNGKSELRNY
jgi:hypothetical protein